MSKFLIQNIQGVLFVGNFAFRKKLDLASKINDAVDNLFDGDPIMLDLPPEAPPEIPRIQLKDANAVYSLNFSPIRVDFFYNAQGKPEKNLDSLSDDYLERLFSIAGLIKAEYHLVVPRIALILKTLREIEAGPNLFVHKKFLGENPFFKDISALEVHALEKTTMKDYHINRWFRIRTGSGFMLNALSVEIDINTMPEEHVDFDLEKIKDFYRNSLEFAKRTFLNAFGDSL
jgi:hypothetical protein